MSIELMLLLPQRQRNKKNVFLLNSFLVGRSGMSARNVNELKEIL